MSVLYYSDFIKGNRVRFIAIILLVIGGSALLAGNNALLTLLGDSLRKGNLLLFVTIIGINFVVNSIGSSLSYRANYLYDKQTQEYFHKLRSAEVEKIYNSGNKAPKVSSIQNSLTQDLNMLGENFLAPWLKIAACGLDVVLSSIIVFTYSWLLLLVILLLAVLMFFMPRFLSPALQKAMDDISNENKRYLDMLEKWFSGLSVLQRYHVKQKLLAVATAQGKELEDANVRRSGRMQFASGVNNAANMLSQALILLVSGVLIITGRMNFGVFFSIGNFASTIFTELGVVVNQYTVLQSSKTLNAKLRMQLAVQTDHSEKTESLDHFQSLSVQSLSVAFSNEEKITYPDFQIKRGEKILLSGDSGTGKSTLFKLILQELPLATGKICFKNEAGQEIERPDLSQIGYVPQDPVLFPGTIKENITMFNSKLNDRVMHFVKQVNLEKDLAKFPAGVDTELDQGKHALSGGQRQKVVLARAQIHDSQLIFIDEGTSAIDTHNGLEILQNLLQTDATIVFIAHNLTEEMRQLFDREIHLSNNAG
ncbi:ABC transporter ATP-binding protein [Lactobacillus delbrueckii subsp. lactis]|uniref:ATP-binding cassette domain-containing protein n=1 Tax=Lactobacillus delbrueckii TaxID=1584 RepID=UPI0011086264|nr:ABC transporter ATP-binding protein [Lactobacillus delbrueckii]MBO1168890.1 ABC transporter ATP-binding protein [Lactobacillus delbrueckii subsp. lactis]MBO1170636.1 ABC transporter ATP-binding protein [Lactobacillus delbrueckii subsp. lactis]MBO1172373.1 ABC transporter ATP-binding protein [Lactobacillus delbrueckii subsp. lactis]MBO1175746.1 ABC transporter ATP-binding protein [Lactobacillus delbrueckii subsp. lactis]MBO1177513.1 ABC transporter ATP-binding protein [Lactobacillus delbruec